MPEKASSALEAIGNVALIAATTAMFWGLTAILPLAA